jgi:hypothetical protein
MKSWTYQWDDQHKVPYLTKGSTWVSYDDAASIRLKTKFATSQRLAGIMVWSLDTDDFAGKCGAQKYPLLRAIHYALSEPTSPGNVISKVIFWIHLYKSVQHSQSGVNPTKLCFSSFSDFC